MIKEIVSWFFNSTEGKQIKNSFDAATVEKIIKGFIWSFLDAGVAAGGAYLLGLHVSDPILGYLLAVSGTGIVNAWQEYKAGNKDYYLNADAQ